MSTQLKRIPSKPFQGPTQEISISTTNMPKLMKTTTYLEDHPMTCKWLVTMVIVRPLNGVIPHINGRTSWLINGGDPNYLQVLG